MDCYFVNNLDLPFNDRVRRGDLYDRFIDEYFVPADIVCVAGGISEFTEVAASFIIRLSQRYAGVYYVYGGCDMKSDITLAEKFETISNRQRSVQKRKCVPVRLDGNTVLTKFDGISVGGATGFDMQEKISDWKWWTDDKKDIFDDERGRVERVTATEPNIVVTYYGPESMQVKNTASVWHYGNSRTKSIVETDGRLLLTNSCTASGSGFAKEDFLIKL